MGTCNIHRRFFSPLSTLLHPIAPITVPGSGKTPSLGSKAHCSSSPMTLLSQVRLTVARPAETLPLLLLLLLCIPGEIFSLSSQAQGSSPCIASTASRGNNEELQGKGYADQKTTLAIKKSPKYKFIHVLFYFYNHINQFILFTRIHNCINQFMLFTKNPQRIFSKLYL